MPSFLADVIPHKVYDRLRMELASSEAGGRFRFSVIATELDKMIQRARSEDFTLRLAKAYKDYIFYAPAFIDFRGRIYRSGVSRKILFQKSCDVCGFPFTIYLRFVFLKLLFMKYGSPSSLLLQCISNLSSMARPGG